MTTIYSNETTAIAKNNAAHQTRVAALRSLRSDHTRKADLLTELFAVVNERNSHIHKGSTPDPRFTDEANREAAKTARSRHIDRYAPKITDIVERASFTATRAKEAAGKHQASNLNDPTVLMRSEQAWTHIVKPALEAGATVFEVAASADPDAVAAIQRFASPWLERSGQDASEVPLAVAARLADLAPTPQAAKEIRAGVTADADLAVIGTITEAVLSGGPLTPDVSVQLKSIIAHEFDGAVQFGINQNAGVPEFHFVTADPDDDAA